MKIKINYFFSNSIDYWFSNNDNEVFLEPDQINYLKNTKTKHFRKWEAVHICDIIDRLFTENAFINIDYLISFERFLIIESTAIQFEDKKLEKIYLDLSEGESSFIVNRFLITKECLKVDLCHCPKYEYEEEIYVLKNKSY